MPIFDKHKSRIKLWVGTGKSKGNVHYSILTHDDKPEDVIIRKMTERILNKHYKNNFTIAVFYDNHSRAEIKRITGNTKKSSNTVNKEAAKIKLWVGLPADMKNATWYNPEASNKLDNTEIIRLMHDKILRDKYKYEFTKAIFFNNQSGIQINTIEGNMKQNKKSSR